MKNLAGDKNCDKYIPKELEEAGIEPIKMPFKLDGEVPTHYCGYIDGWKFDRAWYYWVVKSSLNILLFKYADELHKKCGKEVRVNGDCTCPSPSECSNKPWLIGISSYHVDTQEGLKTLVDMIKLQTKENFQRKEKLDNG